MIIKLLSTVLFSWRFNMNATQTQRRLTTVPLQSSAGSGVGGASHAACTTTPYTPEKGEYTFFINIKKLIILSPIFGLISKELLDVRMLDLG